MERNVVVDEIGAFSGKVDTGFPQEMRLLRDSSRLTILTIAAVTAVMVAGTFALAQQPAAQQPPPARKMTWNEVRRGLFALSKVDTAPIVMLGDSHTEGAPWRELTGCPHLVNRGIGGDTTAKLLARLDDILKLKPRAVFLMIGVNDISLAVPKDTTVGNFKAILDRLAGTHVVAAYVLPVTASYGKRRINDAISDLNGTIGGFVTGRPDTTVLDLRPLLRGSDGYLREEYSYDGLHLSPKAYGVWRDAIAPDIAKYCVP
jgi:lysophospholipase L1-like esterase